MDCKGNVILSKQFIYRFAFSKIVIIFLSAALLGGIAVSFANDMFAFAKPSKAISISLTENVSIYELSELLQNEGVIENALCFWLYATLTNADMAMHYGSVELNSSMGYRDILNKIKNL